MFKPCLSTQTSTMFKSCLKDQNNIIFCEIYSIIIGIHSTFISSGIEQKATINFLSYDSFTWAQTISLCVRPCTFTNWLKIYSCMAFMSASYTNLSTLLHKACMPNSMFLLMLVNAPTTLLLPSKSPLCLVSFLT